MHPLQISSQPPADTGQPAVGILVPYATAFLFTPLRSATVLSLVLAAFSSLRFVVRKRPTSSWPSFFGPGDQRAVSRDLVVFGRLRTRHDGGVRHGLVVDLARDLIGVPGVTVGGGVRYIGESWDGTDTIRTPDYTLFDAMIRYETGPWRFQVNASNLADKRHVTTCLARGDCFFGLGRTVLGSATYRF